ncbi:hypothetical protein HDU88_004432 [Geranomyces variabilis]|nr:hypothetical protein HDU88_004432 [Geranomyces variabilis]
MASSSMDQQQRQDSRPASQTHEEHRQRPTAATAKKDLKVVDASYDAGLEWLHCGRCFEYDHAIQCPIGGSPRAMGAGSSFTAFYVTNCAHLACETCMRQENAGAGSKTPINPQEDHKCPVCGQRASVVELVTEVPEEVEKIFVPAVVHLEDALKVWKLQYGNAVQLIRYLKLKTTDYARKYSEAARALQQARQELKAQAEELAMLKQLSPERGRDQSRIQATASPLQSPSRHSAALKDNNKRPSSSRSVSSSPSRKSIQTPLPPFRLSLPLNTAPSQPNVEPAPSLYYPGPVDVQYTSPKRYAESSRADSAAYAPPTYWQQQNSSQPYNRGGTPIPAQQQHHQFQKPFPRASSRHHLAPSSNFSRPATASGRPRTAMRQPFQQNVASQEFAPVNVHHPQSSQGPAMGFARPYAPAANGRANGIATALD